LFTNFNVCHHHVYKTMRRRYKSDMLYTQFKFNVITTCFVKQVFIGNNIVLHIPLIKFKIFPTPGYKKTFIYYNIDMAYKLLKLNVKNGKPSLPIS